MTTALAARLARQPVIMAIYGMEQLKTALSSKGRVCILANIDLVKLEPVITLLKDAGKFIFVNIDSCHGLSQDKEGIDYVAEAGAMGLLSTRLQTISRARKCGLISMQKIFVTDRSTWLRSMNAIEQSEPDYIQLMPSPMLGLLSKSECTKLPPIVASGFVCNRQHVTTALNHGAVAVSSSDSELWDLTL